MRGRALLALLTISILWGLSESKGCVPKKFKFNSVVCVCNSTYCDTIERPPKLSENGYIIYTSSQAGLRFQMENGTFEETSNIPSLYNTVTTNSNKTFQSIHGWGGAFTDSTGMNILSLPLPARKLLMRSYFAEDGIEYSLGRVPIGGTDFSTHGYSYDDGPADPELKNFHMAQQDYDYKIPFIKEAIDLTKGNLELIASAWTAPIWMKHNGKYTGPDVLRTDMYQSWANYFIKFLRVYKDNGLNFWGITTGNEPSTGLAPLKINSVGWLPDQMATFIADNLGPTLRNSEFSNLKLITIDDQIFSFPLAINEIFASNKNASKYVDGFGLHWYWNVPFSYGALTTTHNLYPDKFILATEACEGTLFYQPSVALGDWRRAEAYANDIIKDLENWVTGWVDWNMALDPTGGPTYIDNNVDSPIIVDAAKMEFYKQPMYYAMGHFSKFVPRNSRRIEVSQSTGSLDVIGFKKPDGENVAVLLNKKSRSVTINWTNKNGLHIKRDIPPKSITTILYQ